MLLRVTRVNDDTAQRIGIHCGLRCCGTRTPRSAWETHGPWLTESADGGARAGNDGGTSHAIERMATGCNPPRRRIATTQNHLPYPKPQQSVASETCFFRHIGTAGVPFNAPLVGGSYCLSHEFVQRCNMRPVGKLLRGAVLQETVGSREAAHRREWRILARNFTVEGSRDGGGTGERQDTAVHSLLTTKSRLIGLKR